MNWSRRSGLRNQLALLKNLDDFLFRKPLLRHRPVLPSWARLQFSLNQSSGSNIIVSEAK
jgi:hypothetical protein